MRLDIKKQRKVEINISMKEQASPIFPITIPASRITLEQTGLLFKHFSQADDSPTSQYGGAGLGLAISKRIIEQMDGSIQVQSTYGKGEIFLHSVELENSNSHGIDNYKNGIHTKLRILVIKCQKYKHSSLALLQPHLIESSNIRLIHSAKIDSEAIHCICDNLPYDIIIIDWSHQEFYIQLITRIAKSKIFGNCTVVIFIYATELNLIPETNFSAVISGWIRLGKLDSGLRDLVASFILSVGQRDFAPL
jgi:hypothetical protein